MKNNEFPDLEFKMMDKNDTTMSNAISKNQNSSSFIGNYHKNQHDSEEES